jgi:hypothetical protein
MIDSQLRKMIKEEVERLFLKALQAINGKTDDKPKSLGTLNLKKDGQEAISDRRKAKALDPVFVKNGRVVPWRVRGNEAYFAAKRIRTAGHKEQN